MDALDKQIDSTLKAKPPRGPALWKRLYARLDTIEQWLNDGGTVTALANGMDISMPAVHRALQKARKYKKDFGSAVVNTAQVHVTDVADKKQTAPKAQQASDDVLTRFPPPPGFKKKSEDTFG